MQEKVSLKSFMQMVTPSLRPKTSTGNGAATSKSKAQDIRQVSRQVCFRRVTVMAD